MPSAQRSGNLSFLQDYSKLFPKASLSSFGRLLVGIVDDCLASQHDAMFGERLRVLRNYN